MNKKQKIYFIAPFYRDRSPSQRFRFEQYWSYFEEQGYECCLLNIVNKGEDKILYGNVPVYKKGFLFVKFFFRRMKHYFKVTKNDVVFVQREACFLGFTIFEYLLSRKAPFIFDFDDAIWVPNVSEANKKMAFLKNFSKTAKIISYSDAVIAGNAYLANYAKQYNQNVTIIPTTVDTDTFVPPKTSDSKASICIGWSGSKTTVQHFRLLENVLLKLKEKYADAIYFKLIGDETYYNEALNLKGTAWSSDTEVSELQEIDIGVMPLENDRWSKGKCGLKGLTYMSLQIATVMSPVGVNKDIIQHNVNGFLAETEEDWFNYLSQLIEDEQLRKRLGQEARTTVVEKYSILANREHYLEVVKGVQNVK